ncbi:MAG: sulfotransferase domain-containing protein [Gallionella sp.]|nr:sulfotransferase domain-containing protein [Gallionella sp.]
MPDFTVPIRDELRDDYRVFYVTAWGYAADHLFGWFPKALNCHRDIFALLAHEGSRPKYLRERTRGERPPLVPFTEFLNDMGMTYSAIGDCYSYRAGQMPELLSIDRYKNIPVVNLVRHPVAWLEFYVRWRASNMRMRVGATDPLEWEWKTACHAYFEYLGLPSYSKDDIDIWASYQGMFQLNNVLGDIHAVQRHIAVEKIADEPETFKDLATYLTRGEVTFDQQSMDCAYSMRHTLFRGESPVECDPDRLMQAWPGWKVDAFRKLVSQKAMDAYASFGYDLKELARRPVNMAPIPGKIPRPVFVSSLPKSGTWLLREMLEMATGLKAHEPRIGEGSPDYENEMLIEFPSGTFFSWHSTLTSRSASLLRGCQAKNIFLIRNIYDVLLSMFAHLSRDVDAAIGRSVIGSGYFVGKTTEQCLTLMISGFTSPQMTWMGAGPLLKQLDSMLELVESGEALLLDYEQLVCNKRETLKKILHALECKLPTERVKEIVALTEKDAMRERLKISGHGQHVTLPEHILQRSVFLPYHKEMIDHAVMINAPRLPERLHALKLDSILRLEAEAKPESKWSQLKSRWLD